MKREVKTIMKTALMKIAMVTVLTLKRRAGVDADLDSAGARQCCETTGVWMTSFPGLNTSVSQSKRSPVTFQLTASLLFSLTEMATGRWKAGRDLRGVISLCILLDVADVACTAECGANCGTCGANCAKRVADLETLPSPTACACVGHTRAHDRLPPNGATAVTLRPALHAPFARKASFVPRRVFHTTLKILYRGRRPASGMSHVTDIRKSAPASCENEAPTLYGNRPNSSSQKPLLYCRKIWSNAGMQASGKREIPDETRRAASSSGTIPTYENPGMTPPGIEQDSSWWSHLTSPRPAIQFVPKMFYRAEVGALGGPVQSANIVVGVPLHSSHPRTMALEIKPETFATVVRRLQIHTCLTRDSKPQNQVPEDSVQPPEYQLRMKTIYSSSDADNCNAIISRNALGADELQRNLLHPDWLPPIETQRIVLLWNQLYTRCLSAVSDSVVTKGMFFRALLAWNTMEGITHKSHYDRSSAFFDGLGSTSVWLAYSVCAVDGTYSLLTTSISFIIMRTATRCPCGMLLAADDGLYNDRHLPGSRLDQTCFESKPLEENASKYNSSTLSVSLPNLPSFPKLGLPATVCWRTFLISLRPAEMYYPEILTHAPKLPPVAASPHQRLMSHSAISKSCPRRRRITVGILGTHLHCSRASRWYNRAGRKAGATTHSQTEIELDEDIDAWPLTRSAACSSGVYADNRNSRISRNAPTSTRCDVICFTLIGYHSSQRIALLWNQLTKEPEPRWLSS
ncbi:hypothetical protein PR048_025004 [Dryococelus australis]|uniref:Uncharacterized protein n=1 Tax=Dryococelus australis TaxID=614101 RepID=A0ABQ9GQ75_9NEOP|nr:hypothetical protein PR048_025004 [Dryococelus australis]